MNFQCPFCSFILRDLDRSTLGRKIQCPNCGGNSHIPNHPFDEGRVIGDFIIKRKIGEGSVGTVYLAQQISLDRTVAVKILSDKYATDEKGVASFLQEARAAAQLNHPNLVQAFSVGKEEDACYMAMTYLKGDTLKGRLKQDKKIPPDEALHIVQQVAEALHYAWMEAKLIHRDVKPDNIIITEDGVVKLTDLGLAIRHQDWHENLDVSGSPSYMSPEQFAGEQLDTRSDIYSLGITLYQILSGRLPFDGDSVRAVAKQHFYDEPIALQKLDSRIPAKVAAFVRKMIAKAPNDRFQTMEELLKEIWDIRQKTAPDRELVPDVHTISLKRLDYDLQKRSRKRQVQVKMIHRQQVVESGNYLLLLVLMIVVLTIAGIVAYAAHHRSAAHLKAKQRLLNRAVAVMDRPDATWEERQAACQQALADFGVPRDPAQRHLRAELELMYARLKNERIEERVQALTAELRQYDEARTDTVRSLGEHEQQLADKVRELAERTAVFRQTLAAAEAERLTAREDLARQQEAQQHLTLEFAELRRSDLRARAYSRIRQSRFREAVALLRIATENDPDCRAWAEMMIARVERMDKLYQGFTASGSRFQGLVVAEGRITRIGEDKISLQDSNNSFITLPWQSLELDSLNQLGQRLFPEVEANELKAEIAILGGRLGEARRLLPESEEMKKICAAICQFSVDQVRVLLELDRKKAAERAARLMREFAGIPEFTERFEGELRAMFGNEASSGTSIRPPARPADPYAVPPSLAE